ncbi:MAG: redox-sensing transcriptional repressor Rex [Planctomycetota bacterium]|jgi:redox-sensing transcriptional repressor
MIATRSQNVPTPVMRRFPKYLAHLQELKQANRRWVQSNELALLTGVISHTVRRDFCYLPSCSGNYRLGYEIKALENALVNVLGLDVPIRAVVVGASQIGLALASDKEITTQGFIICGVFNFDQRLTGTVINDFTVLKTQELVRVVHDENVDIGVIAAPASAAQKAADQLVAAGVRGIMNFSHVHVRVPSSVAIVEMCAVASLQELSCAIKFQSQSQVSKSKNHPTVHNHKTVSSSTEEK